MLKLNLEQKSPEWLSKRLECVTASEISCIMGCNPWKSALELWREKCLGETKPVYTPATLRGEQLETPAKIYAESLLGMKFEPLVVLSEDNPRYMASLDGYNKENDVVIEIKCPNTKTVEDCKNGIIPEYYRLQILFQLMVTKAKYAIYFVFDGFQGHHIRVDPCQKTFKEMDKAAKKFLKMMDDFQEPEPSDQDFIEETSEAWQFAAETYIRAMESKRQAEYEMEAAKSKLEAIAENKVRVKGSGLKYFQSISKGSVDYKAFLTSKGIDEKEAEAFRKAPIVKTNIRIN